MKGFFVSCYIASVGHQPSSSKELRGVKRGLSCIWDSRDILSSSCVFTMFIASLLCSTLLLLTLFSPCLKSCFLLFCPKYELSIWGSTRYFLTLEENLKTLDNIGFHCAEFSFLLCFILHTAIVDCSLWYFCSAWIYCVPDMYVLCSVAAVVIWTVCESPPYSAWLAGLERGGRVRSNRRQDLPPCRPRHNCRLHQLDN